MVKHLGALDGENPGLALPRDLSEEAVDVIPCACVLRAARRLFPAPGEGRDADHRPLGCRGSAGRWETRPHTEGFVYLIASFACSNIRQVLSPRGHGRGGALGVAGERHLPRLRACPRGAAW